MPSVKGEKRENTGSYNARGNLKVEGHTTISPQKSSDKKATHYTHKAIETTLEPRISYIIPTVNSVHKMQN